MSAEKCGNRNLSALHQNGLKAGLKHRLPGPTPRVSDSVGLGESLRTCISNKFPRDTTAPEIKCAMSEDREVLHGGGEGN